MIAGHSGSRSRAPQDHTGGPAFAPFSNRARGFTLAEILVACAVMAIVLSVGVPSVLVLASGVRTRLAAAELAGALAQARSLAIRRQQRVGVRFSELGNGFVEYRLHVDGDGDGVRTADIRNGVDAPLGLPLRFHQLGGDIRLGFPPGEPPRDPADPDRLLDRLHDPVRLGSSNIASFSPLGASTPGTLYLTDGRYHLLAVRLFGRTGKLRILRYDRRTETWLVD